MALTWIKKYMVSWLLTRAPEQGYWQNRETANVGLDSSVGTAPARQSGGRRFKSRSSFFCSSKFIWIKKGWNSPENLCYCWKGTQVFWGSSCRCQVDAWRASKRDARSLGYATPQCRVDVRFAPKTTIVMHTGHTICMGYRQGPATDGNSVAYSVAVKIV